MQYQINKGTKSFGGNTLFENIQFEVKNSEKIAVIGSNGCGKTTLMKIIAGLEELDSGTIHKSSQCSIGYLAQTTFSNEECLVIDELNHVFDDLHEIELELNRVMELMGSDHQSAANESLCSASA